MSNPAASTSAKPSINIGLVIALVLLLLAPMIALSFSPWHDNSSLWYLGMLPTVIGLFSSIRLGISAAFLTPILMFIALLLHGNLWPGVIFMTLIAIATGFGALRGWHMMLSFAGPLTAYALIGNINVAVGTQSVPASSSLEHTAIATLFILGGGLWTVLIGQFLVRRFQLKSPPTVPFHTAGFFAAALGILVAIASFVCMYWLTPNSPESWWLILTIFVVVQPYYTDSTKRVVARVIGTLVGAIAATIIVTLFQGAPTIITSLALILTVAAAWANLKKPYWVFVTFLTPAVVLQTAGGTNEIFESILARSGYTVVGAIASVIVLFIGHWYIKDHTAYAKEKQNKLNAN